MFGMSALYPVLYAEHVLSDYCKPGLQEACSAMRDGTKCCDAQMLQYTLMTSAALLPSDALVAVYGEFVDRVGPRKVYCVGQLFFSAGLLLLIFNSYWLRSNCLWFASFSFLGAAGPGVFFSILFLAEKHPHLGAVITALSAATCDSSAICFFFVQVVSIPPASTAANS